MAENDDAQVSIENIKKKLQGQNLYLLSLAVIREIGRESHLNENH